MKSDEPYALAGLWEKWKDRAARVDLLTFTVITTDPSELVQSIHTRMPVITAEREYDRWLNTDLQQPPIDLLRPFDAGLMKTWRVDPKVGNVRDDTPDLVSVSPSHRKPIRCSSD